MTTPREPLQPALVNLHYKNKTIEGSVTGDCDGVVSVTDGKESYSGKVIQNTFSVSVKNPGSYTLKVEADCGGKQVTGPPVTFNAIEHIQYRDQPTSKPPGTLQISVEPLVSPPLETTQRDP